MRKGNDVLRALADAEVAGRTAVAVAWDGLARGVFVVADAVKPLECAGRARPA